MGDTKISKGRGNRMYFTIRLEVGKDENIRNGEDRRRKYWERQGELGSIFGVT